MIKYEESVITRARQNVISMIQNVHNIVLKVMCFSLSLTDV